MVFGNDGPAFANDGSVTLEGAAKPRTTTHTRSSVRRVVGSPPSIDGVPVNAPYSRKTWASSSTAGCTQCTSRRAAPRASRLRRRSAGCCSASTNGDFGRVCKHRFGQALGRGTTTATTGRPVNSGQKEGQHRWRGLRSSFGTSRMGSSIVAGAGRSQGPEMPSFVTASSGKSSKLRLTAKGAFTQPCVPSPHCRRLLG